MNSSLRVNVPFNMVNINMVEEQVIREAGRQASAAAFKVQATPHAPLGAGRPLRVLEAGGLCAGVRLAVAA